MPIVLRAEGFVFFFYSRDHEPAHVHCAHGDETATIRIANAKTVYKKMREKDARRAEALVAEHREVLQAAWDEFAKKRGREWR